MNLLSKPRVYSSWLKLLFSITSFILLINLSLLTYIHLHPQPAHAQSYPAPANDPDLNITLRGWDPVDGVLQLLANICGPSDPQGTPPQLSTLLNGILNTNPEFTRLFQVLQRDTDPNPKQKIPTDYTNNWGVTFAGLRANPGDCVTVPKSVYKYQEVVYADNNCLTLSYNDEQGARRIEVGYTIHLCDFQVNPEYRNPSIEGVSVDEGTCIGRVTGNDVLVAIRDSGSFMDPRIIKDWWQALPESLGIDLGICAAGLDAGLAPGTEPYVHPQNLAELATYEVTCGNPADTSTYTSGDSIVCQLLGIGCETPLVEVIDFDETNATLAWFNELKENILSRPGSAAKMWSANFSHPEIEKEYDAPYYKSTLPPTQCRAKLEYLEHIFTLCQNYPSLDAPNPETCILPRWFDQQYATDFSLTPEQLQQIQARYRNEIEFGESVLINCDGEYPYGLEGINKLVYDNIIPQIRDEVEDKICYKAIYTERPEGEHFIFNNPETEPKFLIREALCPVTNVGGQKWQSSILDFNLGELDPGIQHSFTDSMMTKSTKNLLRRDVVEKREDKYKAIQSDRFACTTNASINGPVIDLEKFDCNDPANILPCTVAQRINCEALFCYESQGGEKSDITFTPALFGQLRNSISGIYLQPLSGLAAAIVGSAQMVYDTLVKPLVPGEKTAIQQVHFLAPQETGLMYFNNQEIFFPTFRRRDDWDTDQPSFNTITANPNTSKDPSFTWEAILGEIAPGIFDKITYTVGLNSEKVPEEDSVKSRPQDFVTESQDIFRRRANKGNLTNSGCREDEDRKSDCYWKTDWVGEYIPPFTPSTRPGIDLPNTANCIDRPDSDIPQKYQILLGNFKDRFIGLANDWIKDDNDTHNAKKCFNDVIYRAVTNDPPINPIWALTVWLNESDASNYAASAKLWQDFGINNPEVPAENFDAQITRFLNISDNLITDYQKQYSQCFTSGYSDMQVAMYVYHLGPGGCPNQINTTYYDAIFGPSG